MLFFLLEVIYGGRVTNCFDRRLIWTYLDEYLGDFVFDKFQPFHFFVDREKSSIGFDYFLPKIEDFSIESISGNIFRDVFLFYVEQMPRENRSELVGLNSNVEEDFSRRNAERILEKIAKIQPEEKETKFDERKEFLLSSIETIERKIPAKKNRRIIEERFQNRSNSSIVVLLREIDIFDEFIDKLERSIDQIRRAAEGKTFFSPKIEQIEKSIRNGIVPNDWTLFTSKTNQNLPKWIEQLEQRNEQYDRWIENGSKIRLLILRKFSVILLTELRPDIKSLR